MKQLALGGLLIVSAWMAVAQTKIYQWQDANGNVVFSDRHRPGAQEITVQPPPASEFAPAVAAQQQPRQAAKTTAAYRLTIVVPEPQATLRDNEGNVTVIATTEPIPGSNHRFQLMLDGQPTGTPSKTAHFAVQNLPRGEHQAQINLLNSDGKIIASSQRVTFFLHRASVLNQPNTGG